LRHGLTGLRAALSLAAVAVASAAMAAEARTPTTAEGWRAAYVADLDFIRDAVAADHPGPVDPANPTFAAWLKTGYAEARARAGQVSDDQGYRSGLMRFAGGFHDSHTAIWFDERPDPPPSWPGFMVARRLEGDVVTVRDEADPAAPAMGTRILSCDGRSLDALTARDIFPAFFDPRLPDDRRRAVTHLFNDEGDPFRKRLTACRIRTPDGEARSLKLAWRPPPDRKAYVRELIAVTNGAAAAWFSLQEPAEGVAWISLPTFQVEDRAADVQALVARVKAEAPRLRQGRLIVFDARGNGGGSSVWGQMIVEALWGPEAVAAATPKDAAAVDWRASPRNKAYFDGLQAKMDAQYGVGSPASKWMVSVREGLGAAIAAGRPLWREGDPSIPATATASIFERPKGPGLFPAKVVLLTDGRCGSACLDFTDVVLRMPGVVFAGGPTGGDGLYMERADRPTPSGLAMFGHATKVYRGRPRGDMEVYQPDVPWGANRDDDKAVRAWILAMAGKG